MMKQLKKFKYAVSILIKWYNNIWSISIKKYIYIFVCAAERNSEETLRVMYKRINIQTL